MTFADAEVEARDKWDRDKLLRYAFPDFSSFLQIQLLARFGPPDINCAQDYVQGESDRMAAEQALRRYAAVRNPVSTKDSHRLVERHGNRGVVWLYGQLVGGRGSPGQCGADDIVDGIVANADTAAILFRISSPGGKASAHEQVLHALAAYRGRSVAIIDHFACSAAALLAIGCHHRIMRRNAVLMMHRPFAIARGDHYEMTEYARLLRHKANEYMKFITYRCRATPRTRAVIAAAIEDERYIGAQEALDLRLIDAIAPPLLGSDDYAEIARRSVNQLPGG